jgi:hypothetical protein
MPTRVDLEIDIKSFLKNIKTENIVPIWITAVKDAPGSFWPNNAGRILKCALEEIGRNSVTPCTTPIAAASHQDKKFLLTLSKKSIKRVDSFNYCNNLTICA